MPKPITEANRIVLDLPTGHWSCRWIGDMCYEHWSEGNRCTARVSYAKDDGTMRIAYSNAETLLMTIPGYKLAVQNKVAKIIDGNADYRPKRDEYIFPIEEASLSVHSNRIYRHMGLYYEDYVALKTNEQFLKSVVFPLQLPADFGIGEAHLIPNHNTAYGVDNFLIPSYEILRYFFLQSSLLAYDLLSYFTGHGERVTRQLTQLYTHPTGEPSTVERNGQLLALLLVREGLKEQDINCLARIAFIPQAFDCLELVRESLLLNSWDKRERAYMKLATMIPHDAPFRMAVCGRRFEWQGTSYLLVEEIYDTDAKLPFDRVLYAPFTDHRSQAIIKEAKTKQVHRPGTARNTLAAKHQFTTETVGNTAQPVLETLHLPTKHFFEQTLADPIKAPKAGQQDRYQVVSGVLLEQELLSLLEKGVADANAGRGRLHRKDYESATSKPASTLFGALKLLRNYHCYYFNLDTPTIEFSFHYHLNRQQGKSRSFDLLLCRLEPKDKLTKYNIYLLWANSRRYAIFYAKGLRQLAPTLLADYCSQYFGHQGVYAEFEMTEFQTYGRRNQYSADAAELAIKLEKELSKIVDANSSRIR